MALLLSLLSEAEEEMVQTKEDLLEELMDIVDHVDRARGVCMTISIKRLDRHHGHALSFVAS